MTDTPITPDTIVTLRRMIEWRWLVQQMAKRAADRDASLRATLGEADLNMNIIVTGSIKNAGEEEPHFCVSACCALGAASLYPRFMAQGLRPYVSRYGSLSSYKLWLDGEETRYDDPRLADWFGIGEEHYLRITDPAAYRDIGDAGGPDDEESSIEPHEVIARMEAAIISAYGPDALRLTPADFPRG